MDFGYNDDILRLCSSSNNSSVNKIILSLLSVYVVKLQLKYLQFSISFDDRNKGFTCWRKFRTCVHDDCKCLSGKPKWFFAVRSNFLFLTYEVTNLC